MAVQAADGLLKDALWNGKTERSSHDRRVHVPLPPKPLVNLIRDGIVGKHHELGDDAFADVAAQSTRHHNRIVRPPPTRYSEPLGLPRIRQIGRAQWQSGWQTFTIG